MTFSRPEIPARGACSNPPNRFDRIHVEPDPDWDPQSDEAPRTQYLRDQSQSVISYNRSPDVPFEASLNPYRGCEHGCAYCYARPTHEYLGFSSGLDFETRILVKEDAPRLLRLELAARTWQPRLLALSGVTDPYQPIERRLQITRQCLAVLAECRNPVGIVTKNRMLTRDLDHLRKLACHRAVSVSLSLTTLDVDLARRLEPRAASPTGRLEAIKTLKTAGVPVGVLLAPVIPGLNDHEIPSLLAAAADAGAQWAGMVILRLPHAVAALFEDWLERNAPSRKEKVLNRIRALRGGGLNEGRFGSRMRGQGPWADRISQMFEVARRRSGLPEKQPELSCASFRRPLDAQLDLFDP